MSLTPYMGSWDQRTAAHLLRRTTFGSDLQTHKDAVDLGLEGSINKLFEDLPAPEPPVKYRQQGDSMIDLGDIWVEVPHDGDNATRNSRQRSLLAWQLANIDARRFNIEEKILGFWHNHFPIDFQTVRDPRYLYKYWETLRTHATGNFKQLIKEITIDPAMLRYLDGRTNTRRKPNENYARELLELFTIGKGPIVGPGDYTHYTEDDVLEIAKVLTGWRDTGYNSQTVATVFSNFVRNNHDTSTKILSHRFDNVEINNADDLEYGNLIDIIFEKDEVARFITRKLYRYFVATQIDGDVEQEIIEPLAVMIRQDGYDLKRALRTLFSSEHFYAQLEVEGGIIANPLEYAFTMINGVGTDHRSLDYIGQYNFWYAIFAQLSQMQMAFFQSPDVAGWQAYYLEPQYSELWVNSVTIRIRMTFANSLTSTNGFRAGGAGRVKLDLLGYIAQFDQPEDPVSLINEAGAHFYPQPLSQAQVDQLKEILIPGLPDYEWTIEYEDYLADPANDQKRNAILNRLRALFRNLFIIPEFQVI